MTARSPAPHLAHAGQLIVAGFDGTTLPSEVARDLAAGGLGGIILFRRNLTADPLAVAALNEAACAAVTGSDAPPPFTCIDQEGGRVARLGPPVVKLPPMLPLAERVSLPQLRRAGAVLGAELRALGFASGLAPVLDVDSNPANPVIGDRAFGHDAAVAVPRALAFAAGLADAGLAACGKHFPGHGDTETDSHLTLPVVRHDLARLREVELAPFVAAAKAGLPAFMTAHVLYPALDEARPATLSPLIVQRLLRDELGYDGVVFSDDLEMKALTAPVEETAVLAVLAGCDALLVCSKLDWAGRAREALVREAETSAAFRARLTEAHRRFVRMRLAHRPRPEPLEAIRALLSSPERRALESDLTALGFGSAS